MKIPIYKLGILVYNDPVRKLHMILESAKISASKFTWFDGVGTVMASDLGFRAGQVPVHQIYDDACDGGWVVCGRKENKVFIYKNTIVSSDGELNGWLFESPDFFRIVIFND